MSFKSSFLHSGSISLFCFCSSGSGGASEEQRAWRRAGVHFWSERWDACGEDLGGGDGCGHAGGPSLRQRVCRQLCELLDRCSQCISQIFFSLYIYISCIFIFLLNIFKIVFIFFTINLAVIVTVVCFVAPWCCLQHLPDCRQTALCFGGVGKENPSFLRAAPWWSGHPPACRYK